MFVYFIRNIERFRTRPAEIFLHGNDVVFTKRRAMGRGLALFSRAAIANLRMHRNKGRVFCISFSCFDCFADSFHIVAVSYFQQLETKRFHAFLYIFRKGNIRTAFDGNIIAVIENNQFAQAQCACQGKCF